MKYQTSILLASLALMVVAAAALVPPGYRKAHAIASLALAAAAVAAVAAIWFAP